MSRIGAFNKRTIQQLAEATDYCCARCRIKTSYFDSERGKRIGFGRAAHAVAASPGGPRFDESYTVEQLRASDNGVHLCANCADLVDRVIDLFPVSSLQDMQFNAETRVRELVMQGRSSFTLLNPDQSKRIAEFTQLAGESINHLTIYKGRAGWEGQWKWGEAEKAIDFYRRCSCINMLHHELCGGIQEVIHLQVLIVNNILNLYKQVKKAPWLYVDNGIFSNYSISAIQSYGDRTIMVNEAGSATYTLSENTYHLISTLKTHTFAGNMSSSFRYT